MDLAEFVAGTGLDVFCTDGNDSLKIQGLPTRPTCDNAAYAGYEPKAREFDSPGRATFSITYITIRARHLILDFNT